jgi:hypothetical protein
MSCKVFRRMEAPLAARLLTPMPMAVDPPMTSRRSISTNFSLVTKTYSTSCCVLKDLGQRGHVKDRLEGCRFDLIRGVGAAHDPVGLDGGEMALGGDLILGGEIRLEGEVTLGGD